MFNAKIDDFYISILCRRFEKFHTTMQQAKFSKNGVYGVKYISFYNVIIAFDMEIDFCGRRCM